MLLEGAYASADADLALSLATVRCQMALEQHGEGVQHAAALGELVNAQLFKCEKPTAIKQVPPPPPPPPYTHCPRAATGIDSMCRWGPDHERRAPCRPDIVAQNVT